MASIPPVASSTPTPEHDTPNVAPAPGSVKPQPAPNTDRIEPSASESTLSQLGHGARAIYDFMLGDDLENTFGKDKTLLQRGLGAASLASNFVPVGKVASLGIKVLEHAGIEFGAHALEHAAEHTLADAGTHAVEHTAETAARDVGGKHPSFDLQAIEKGGSGQPHTLENHVNKNFADRLSKDPKLLKSSSYTDIAAAQRATDHVIGAPENQAKIDKWLADGAQRPLALEAKVAGDPIGKTISRADLAAGRGAQNADNARVLLQADPASRAGYTVLTSYPTK